MFVMPGAMVVRPLLIDPEGDQYEASEKFNLS